MSLAEVVSPLAQDTFEQLLEKRVESGVPTHADHLRKVFAFVVQEYGNTMHWTGEKLIDHCLGILRIFLRFDPDDDMIAVCLLHHILDKKQWTLDAIEARFGHDVRHAISNEFLLSHVTLKNRRMSLENLRLMFLKVSQDLQLVLLILSQQYHMLEMIERLSMEDRKRVCRDTLHIYAPVAARLGIYWLKNQMEAKAFPVIHPVDAVRIAEQLEQVHEIYGHFLPSASLAIQTSLREAGLEASLEMREKQPYSIFHKMKMKSVSHVEDIYDLFALRVIVSDEAACYQALGVLHRLGHPVAGRFKDYIAFPKPNGYKSLHTTLAQLPGVPAGMFIEVQIRTSVMQHEAEYGVTAHWSYKEGGNHTQALQHTQVQQALLSPRNTKPDQIFVLTPQGDIIELPEGATPLDFAFHVHTTLGLSFKAAKVNGSIVQASHTLENGDIVEILKYPNPQPSHRWMSLLKTSSARARLKKYLHTKERPEHIARGREVVNEYLRKKHLPVLDADLSVLRFYNGEPLSAAEREDLLAKAGSGTVQVTTLVQHLDLLKVHAPQAADSVVFEHSPKYQAVAKVEGSIRMPLLYAKCCKPEDHKGEELAGVVSRSGDVRVHSATCKMLRSVNPERRIGVKWTAAVR